MAKQGVKVGLLLRQREPGAFVSVDRVYRETLRALREKFRTEEFSPDSYRDDRVLREEFRNFTEQVDVLFLLPGAPFLKREREIPMVFHALGSMPKGGTGFFKYADRIQHEDVVLFSSRADVEIFRRAFGGFLRNFLVPFGVDCERFRPLSPEENRSVREGLGIPPEGPLLLYAGRINVQKNLHTLLMLFRKVVDGEPKCTLCIAGQEDETSLPEFGVDNRGYKKSLEDLIARYGLQGRVVMPGNLEEEVLAALYSAADIFVNCTLHHDENFGFAQVEAMACGTPVVCSKWGGLKDTVVHGKTGFHMDAVLTGCGVKVDWREGVRYILELLGSPPLLKELSGNSREHVRRNYSLERFYGKMGEAVLSALESCERREVEVHPEAVRFWREYVKHQMGPHRNPLFSENYDIYKFFIEPYASRNADDTALGRTSVPYFPAEVGWYERSKCLEVQDPIWPREYSLDEVEFRVLREVDGEREVEAIWREVRRQVPDVGYREVEGIIARFFKEGVVLV